MIYQKMEEMAKSLYEKGWLPAYTGSISIAGEDKFFITRSKANLAKLKTEDILELSLHDTGNTSLDFAMAKVHRAIYQESQKGAKAILSAYPPYLTALSIMTDNKIMLSDLAGSETFANVPIVRVRKMDPAEELLRFLVPVFKNNYQAAVVRGYGSFVVASDIEEAFNLTELLEASSQITYLVKGGRREKKEHPRSRPDFNKIGVMPPPSRNTSRRGNSFHR